MNVERPDERDAARIVETVLGVDLRHADQNGGVDYLSTDGRHAVEVTRVTDGRKRAGRDALTKSRQTERPVAELQTCWLVIAPDTQPRLKDFRQLVRSAVVELEQSGERFFVRGSAATHVLAQGPLSRVYEALLYAGVERASAALNHSHVRHTHKLFVSLGSGGSSSGSDEALGLLSVELNRREDNPRKLRESGAAYRHLFVWLDGDTRLDISRPLSHEPPSWSDGQFGLPSTAPAVDHAISHLWVVHQGSRNGWLWDGSSWRALPGPDNGPEAAR